jgi:phage antirepressor YoqD-like protein
LEDNLVIVVFPSSFSQNKVKPLITNIKKILKMENQKFHKIRREGDVIIVETSDPVFTSSAINTLFGIKSVAIAKQVTNNFNSIVNSISKVGADIFLESERFLIKVEGHTKGFMTKDVEITATSSLIEKTARKGIKPGTDEKYDRRLYTYLTKPYAYICIYYDKGLGGIPNNSQNKNTVCCVFDELSAVSCLETIKQGFDAKIIVCYAKKSELLHLVKMVNQLIRRLVKPKIDLEFYKISVDKKLTPLLQAEIIISLSLSPLIYPIDFLESMVKQIYNDNLVPYLPLSGLDGDILVSAKEIGLEKYLPKIEKIGKSKFDSSKQSIRKIEKITELSINTKKSILIKIGLNNVHDILDKIR